MIKTDIPIYLASNSPRRQKLLSILNIKFDVIPVDTAEKPKRGEAPVQTVKRIANEKMEAAREKVKDGIILTADTIVVIDNRIIGKPKDEADAARILRKLSGRIHDVYTGFSVYNCVSGKGVTSYEKTAVSFRVIEEEEIEGYIAGGSPMDKAGAYGIQDDFGAVFVKKINGDYYNVVGLPLTKVYEAIKGLV
jgi:septum formation protein